MEKKELEQLAILKGYATKVRHIFLCTGGKCATEEASLELWEYLKNKLRELEPNSALATIARSKVDCLRICQSGPIALVYPEGTLYSGLTKEKLEKIITQHLVNGMPVKEYSFFEKPL